MKQSSRWCALSLEEIAHKLKTDFDNGLTPKAALERQKIYGKNIFEEGRKFRFLEMFVNQFKNPFVFILLIAGIVTFLLGAYLDMTVIFIALFINVVIGVFQEGRASRAFEKLKQSLTRYALVLREGRKFQIPAQELVPGDVIFLGAGSLIPADARILEGSELLINESALTGEWLPVSKDARGKVGREAPITDQTNMVWMGTSIAGGTGKAVVAATGSSTQIGSIAESLLEEKERATPLQRRIRKLARFLSVVIVLIIAVITIAGILQGESIGEMFLVAVALAVAAIPAGLPAAVTIVLALGMEGILKRKGLVRNLLAAETLGSTTIILTDKTGTLTEAKMKVSAVVTHLSLTMPPGEGQEVGELALSLHTNDEQRVFEMAILASDAFVEWRRKDSRTSFEVRGRPIERAILLAGLESGLNQENLLDDSPRVDFLPFDSSRRFAASLHAIGGSSSYRMIIIGAPELIINQSSFVLHEGGRKPIDEGIKKRLIAFQKEESGRGARMVAVAHKNISNDRISTEIKKGGAEALVGQFVFGGFIVLDDPIRPDAKKSISAVKQYGIQVVMLTGDHEATAARVAEEVGIKKVHEPVLLGDDIEKLADTELLDALKKTKVFARVLPNQKLRIVRLLKGEGEVIAMTGDGINDAPALQSADIGIALGSGTDVAKEASDLVLLDDGFDIIVYAIEEGRRIIDNLKKIVAYLLSTGFSEIFVVAVALLASAPLPILPAQILWINIIEEGFMSFAFAFEPKEAASSKRNLHAAQSTILTSNLKKLISIIALVTGFFLIVLYFFLLRLNLPIEEIRTIMFIALSVDSIFFSFSLKNLHKPVWKINLFSNKYLLFAVTLSIIALFAALSFPPFQTLLSLEPFSNLTLVLIMGLGVFNLLVIEVAKYFVFIKSRKS